MKYHILGATGPTGLQILQKLKGRDVSVYVRNASKLPPNHGVKVTEGALTDSQKLLSWAKNSDVVLCALGHGLSVSQILSNLGVGSYPQKGFMTQTMKIVLEARPKRIVHCSAYGTRETRGDLPFVFGKILLPLLIAQSYADHESVETLLSQSEVEWVVARPGMLTNEPGKGVYRMEDRFTHGQSAKIARADVADFMVRAAEGSEYVRRCVGLAY